ncbi:MAG: DUF2244 domain-containing protein, partial [Hyphomicrobiaceae bacterium]|nr:DUF2244 domain-containing protein [Hyphomicrobiaceae bacterium]
MNEIDEETQARIELGRGLSRKLGRSRATTEVADRKSGRYRFRLISYRSLSRTGFRALMAAVIAINVAVGGFFLALGAWPILGFCGLDIALVYWAFKANYHAGLLTETIDLSPAAMTLTRDLPSGKRETYEFNPFWVRVRLKEQADGRNALGLSSHGKEMRF